MTTVARTSELAIAGSFSIDSVLTPDGRYVVGKVGGNALWSSLGVLMSGLSPRVLAVVGDDYPAHVLEALAAAGIDTRAVVRIDRTHPVRVTFAHGSDGSRIQPVPRTMLSALPAETQAGFVDTTLQPDVLDLGAPRPEYIPGSWLEEVDFWHLPLLPLRRHRALVEKISGGGGHLQADCPARSDLLQHPFDKLAATLASLDVFLPSTSDFDVVAPRLDTASILSALRGAGARTIVLKAGPAGAFVLDGDTVWQVPAFVDPPVDPTGAGDAFCGGFLAGTALYGDLVAAAALGAATASFAVATEDPLTLTTVDPEQTLARANAIRARVTRLDDLTITDARLPALSGHAQPSALGK